MKLKIKDNIKLQILEELGFEFDDKNYSFTNDGFLHIFINKETRTIEINILDYISNLHMNSNEFCTNNYDLPTIIYTLIKMDLIEII